MEEKKEEKTSLKGLWEISRIDKKTGKVIDKEVKENLIVTSGKGRVAKLLNGVSTDFFDHIAIGTGTIAPVAGDTALGVEIDRKLATTSFLSPDKAVFERTFDFTASHAITESGIFNQLTVSGSIMLNRLTFTAKNVDAATSLFIKITITIA